jgi:hypothetical protein
VRTTSFKTGSDFILADDNYRRTICNVLDAMQLLARMRFLRTTAGRQRRDVTDRVRSLVRDGRLYITVGNDILGGDPAPNILKALSITYSTGRGRQQEVRVNEGQRHSVP